VLQEGNQRRRDADDLARGHIHVVNAVARCHQKTLVMAGRHALVNEVIAVIQQSVGLGDGVAIFLVSRQILDLLADKGHDRHRLDLPLSQLRLHLRVNDRARCDTLAGGLVRHLCAQHAPHQLLVVERHLAVDAAVRRLNEAVLVDTPIAGQATDQADIRAFRRLNGADASIVAVMHIAHVEAGALAAQAARPQGRQRALVC